MFNTIKRATLFALMRTLPAPRNPVAYLLVFIYPMFFIFLYSIIGGREMLGQVLLAIPVIYAMNTGVVSLSQLSLEYKLRRLQEVYVASPITPITYMLGLGLSRLFYVLPVVLLIVAILVFLGQVSVLQIPVVFFILAMTWLTGCVIGFMLSLYISDLNTMSSVANLIGLAFAILPPVLYPIDMLGEFAGKLCLLIPSVSAAHLLRIMAGLTEYDTPMYFWGALFVLITWTVLCGVAVVSKSRWRDI